METNEYTVGELLRVALGAPKLLKENLVILHAVFLFLLEKLNCRNEIVSISEREGRCLSAMISECRDPPINLKRNIQLNFGSPENLTDLEERSLQMQEKLEEHFDIIRQFSKRLNGLYCGLQWGHYTSENEDLCGIPGIPESEDCLLVQNGHFNLHLSRNMLVPILNAITRLEARTEEVEDRIRRFNKEASEIHQKLDFIGPLIKEIENIKKQFTENNAIRLVAIGELDEMLVAKLDQIHSPCLINYIKKRSKLTREIIKKIGQRPKTCMLLKPLKIIGDKCLSCGTYGGNVRQKKASTKVECDREKREICPNPKVRKPRNLTDHDMKIKRAELRRPIKLELEKKQDSFSSFYMNDNSSISTILTLGD